MMRNLILLTVIALVFWSCAEQDTGVSQELLDAGLQVEDTEVGSGEPAQRNDILTIHFTGYLSNGEVFESTYDYDNPIEVLVGAGQLPIRGWDEGMLGMRKGGKRTLTIPSELAAGEQGMGDFIPPNEDLTMEVELIDISTPPEQWEYPEDELETTESGLQYYIHEEGSGDPPAEGDLVTVHYTGFLQEDGTYFDSSVMRDDPFQFEVGTGQVIQGWDEGVLMMKEGERRTLVIPPELGYGASGAGQAIPPNATLVFDIEMISIGE